MPRWARGLPSQRSASERPSPSQIALGDRHVEDVEAGAEDDRVDLALGPVRAHDRAPADLGDPVGDDLDVRPAQRRQVVVGDQDALAARQVVGRELRAQLRVANRAAQVPLADQAQQRCQRDSQHRDRDRLASPVDRRADQRAGAPGSAGRRRARGGSGAGRGAASPTARCAGRGAASRPSAGSAGRTGSRSRPCRSPRRARPRGRGRDPRWRSERGSPRSRRGRGCRAASARAAARRRRSARGRSAGRSTSPGASAPPRRPSARSRPRSRSARARAAPRRRRRGAGSRGSRAGRRRSSSSPGWARTRTSRRGSGRRSDSPDTCSRARCRRPRGRARGSRSRRAPRVCSRAAIASPQKPLPTIAISISCCSFMRASLWLHKCKLRWCNLAHRDGERRHASE